MPDHEVRAINEASKSINKSLEDLKVDVSQSKNLLEKIVGFFSLMQKTIETGINRIIQNQSILMIISKTSELESFRDLLSEQQRVLEQKKSYLVKDLNKLSDRYLQLNDEFSQNAENTIQQLDGHVINLTDDFYMDTIGKAYDQLAAPLSLSSERYFLDCSSNRNRFIEGTANQACIAIDKFLGVRVKFHTDTEKYFDLDDSVRETRSAVVPFFVLKEKQSSDLTVMGPGRISYTGSGADLTNDSGIEEVEGLLNKSDKAEKISATLTFRSLSPQEKEDWLNMLDYLFEQGLLNDLENTDLRQALQKCIHESDIEIGERIDG